MRINQASRTAQYMAFFRGLETKRKAEIRLFDDPYAIDFLDPGLRFAIHAATFPVLRTYIKNIIQKKIPGAFSSGVARTKYIDDLLLQTINQDIKQVLILGAGFDTRASRLDFMKSIPVIEIDHPSTSNFKINTIKKSIGQLPENITYCQLDFNAQSLEDLAVQHNFNFKKQTTVIWEGVTNYLTEEAISKTFSFISKFPEGSYVIFTYVHKEVLENPASFVGAEKLLNDLENIEERWTFGFLPQQLPDYLKQFGLKLIEDLGATEYRAKYLTENNEKGYEFYRVAIAKKSR